MSNYCFQVINSKMQEIQAIIPYLTEYKGQNRKKEITRIQQFLVKFPLFRMLREKKEESHLKEISLKIRLVKYKEGDVAHLCEQNRHFSLVIQGSALLYIQKADDVFSPPLFFRKIVPNDYFGERLFYNGADKLHSVKFQSTVYLLELGLEIFYRAFQDIFTFDQLTEKVEFLKGIWIFKSVREGEIKRILLMSRPYKYAKNAVIFEQGSVPSSVFVVVEGELILAKKDKFNGKHKSIMILGKGQICAWEEVINKTVFEYSCIVTSSSAVLLKIARALFLNVFDGKISRSVIQSSKEIMKELIERNNRKPTFSLQASHQSPINQKFRRKKRKQSITMNPKNYESQKEKLQIANISNTEIDWKTKMKNRMLRQHTLLQLQKNERKKAKMRISTVTNSSFTNEKELLLDYLLRKEKIQIIADEKQEQFRKTVFHIVPQLKIQRSTAVKNQMRKMKQSRKRTSESLPNLGLS